MQVFVVWPVLVCPYVGVHWRALFNILSLHLHQCPACLIHLTRMFYDYTTAVLWGAAFRICSKHYAAFLYTSHLAFFPGWVRVQVVQPGSSSDMATVWKHSCLILSNFHMVDRLLIAVHAFPMCILTFLSVDKILLPKYSWINCLKMLKFVACTGSNPVYGTTMGAYHLDTISWLVIPADCHGSLPYWGSYIPCL